MRHVGRNTADGRPLFVVERKAADIIEEMMMAEQMQWEDKQQMNGVGCDIKWLFGARHTCVVTFDSEHKC